MEQLSIIIVNYKSSQLIVDCINSALQFASCNNFEWIIVDNDSKDNSQQILTSQFPFIQYIQMGYNAGFARANNEGIRQSKGDVVLLLNPDTIILYNALEICLNKFVQSKFVACGVQLLNEDKTTQISGSHFMKGGINHLLPLPYWGNLLKSFAKILKTKKPSIETACEEEPVDWISGAFLMVKKLAIEQVGLMNEDFFLYAEEVEWCSRLKKVGELCIYGNIHIIHLIGETINKASGTKYTGYENLYDKKGLQLMLSNHVRIRKQYGLFWLMFQLLNFSFAIPVFLFCSIIDNLFQLNNPFKDWNRISGLFINVIKLWKLLPTIIANKPHFYKVL